jgi:cell division protease FtsH
VSDSDRPRQRADEPKGNSGLWYLLLATIGTVLIGAFLFSRTQYNIPYPDLLRLLDATRYEELDGPRLAAGYQSSISTNSPGMQDRRIEFARPRSITLGAEWISGQVEYRPVRTASLDDQAKPRLVTFRTRWSGNDEQEKLLIRKLEEARIAWRFDESSSTLGNYGPVLLMIGAIALLTFYMLRKLNGVGSPMSFARSRGRLHAEEDLNVTFNDVAGIDEAVEEVREIVDFLKNPEKYQRLGGRIPKGVLLVGPPGTGKTLLAKAIAGEAGVPFFSLSGSDFVEMFVGVGAARVRDMFSQATSRAPCIIFIDELDALGKSRGGNLIGGHDEREQTLNALLVEMDGFDSNAGVIIIGATNRPETLDPALLRPGRFDRHVLVDRPDVRGREQILKVHVENVKLDPNVNLAELASITSGFVGADLANLVNEAALLAARAEKKSVGMVEFNEAVERVTAGLEKKRRVMQPEEKQRVAYHEAGHALVAYSLPNTDPVHKVSIIPRGLAALGYTMQRPLNDRYLMTRSELESQIKVLLAGTLTEEMYFSDISTGAQNDLERATELSRAMVMDFGMSRLGRIAFRESNRSPFLAGGMGEGAGARFYSEQTAREIDAEVKRILEESLQATREILEQRRPALEAVTSRLLEVESIDGDELRRVIEEHSPGPRVVPGTLDTTRPRKEAPALRELGERRPDDELRAGP